MRNSVQCHVSRVNQRRLYTSKKIGRVLFIVNKETQKANRTKFHLYTSQANDIISYLWINFFFLCSSCSLGNIKPKICWHSLTMFISPVQNNFIKNWFTTKSKLLMSALFKAQASSSYKNAGIHLLWISCCVNVFCYKGSNLTKDFICCSVEWLLCITFCAEWYAHYNCC